MQGVCFDLSKQGFIWLFATLLFMALIFLKSGEPYHEQDLRPALSAWIPLRVLETVLPQVEFYYDKDLISWKEPYDMLEFFIRKAAHVAEFGVLAWLWIRTLLHTRLGYRKLLAFSFTATFLYAASDEWHQTFVTGRTGHLVDVWVDTIGISLVALYYSVRPDCRSS
ncbi:VanZ family protein [Effusibacillus lacus]|nr:VanZ family protein [Effusibacillus lacus]